VTAIIVWAVLGAALAASTWAVASTLFEVPPLQRTNYRNARVSTGVGVLVPVTMIVLAAVGLVWEQATPTLSAWDLLLWPALVAAAGFSLLGLLDDVAGQGQSGGFRGHLDELRRGQLTSGMVKLIGGAALGVVVAARMGTSGGAWGAVELLRNGAVVALAANLANLLDRAPGRTIKAAAIAFAITAVVSRSAMLAVPAGGIGAGLGLLRADLTERCMLGDAGSNALGALCGLAALVAAPGAAGRWAVLAVLVAANLASEAVSFSKVIDAVPPLRWFDRLGSRRPT
jgi:UDP-N-acetylmuramyl pentapeptide phosphotransferase/UDP-N-acetylglucosamine-1-phosphate transferase